MINIKSISNNWEKNLSFIITSASRNVCESECVYVCVTYFCYRSNGCQTVIHTSVKMYCLQCYFLILKIWKILAHISTYVPALYIHTYVQLKRCVFTILIVIIAFFNLAISTLGFKVRPSWNCYDELNSVVLWYAPGDRFCDIIFIPFSIIWRFY